MHSSRLSRHRRLVWSGLLAVTSLVFGAALSTPLWSPGGRAVVMNLFAPVCHQIPMRSPFLGGVQIAICDRCAGIYLGLVLGVATVWGARRLWQWAGRYDRYLLLSSLVPMGIDWVGPLLGLWPNAAPSRALTGLIFGLIAASFVADRLLWRGAPEYEAGPSTGTERTGFA